MDLALNNLQRLIYHKTQPTNQPTKQPTNPITQHSPPVNGALVHVCVCVGWIHIEARKFAKVIFLALI